MVNRSAFILRPREPYLRWAASLDEDAANDAEGLESRVSVYLAPEHASFEEETPPLEEFYEEIFEIELSAWSEDEAMWPRCRDLDTFQKWFEVGRESVVVDLGVSDLQIFES